MGLGDEIRQVRKRISGENIRSVTIEVLDSWIEQADDLERKATRLKGIEKPAHISDAAYDFLEGRNFDALIVDPHKP